MLLWRRFRDSESRTLLHPSVALPESEFLRALRLKREGEANARATRLLSCCSSTASRRGTRSRTFQEDGSRHRRLDSRATDIAGSHTDNPVFGVIFGEFGTVDKESALKALGARLTLALESMLGAGELNRLSIAFHYSPEARGDGGQEWPAILPLYPNLTRRDETRRVSRAPKRTVDVVDSVIAILLLLPLLLGIAAAIKLSSPGPVLFKQRRIGHPVEPTHCARRHSCGHPRKRHGLQRTPAKRRADSRRQFFWI
jgi:hypothetical protein